MKQPNKKDIYEFKNTLNTLNVNTFNSAKEYGEIMLGVMNDTGVTDDFDFKDMAMLAAIRALENRIETINQLRFEITTVGEVIKEITRPFGG